MTLRASNTAPSARRSAAGRVNEATMPTILLPGTAPEGPASPTKFPPRYIPHYLYERALRDAPPTIRQRHGRTLQWTRCVPCVIFQAREALRHHRATRARGRGGLPILWFAGDGNGYAHAPPTGPEHR